MRLQVPRYHARECRGEPRSILVRRVLIERIVRQTKLLARQQITRSSR